MSATLALDPGTRTGYAVARGPSLLSVGVVVSPLAVPRALELVELYEVTTAIVEVPIARVRGGSPADPNDVITLARRAERLCAALEFARVEVRRVTPSGWKGSAPKARHHAAVARRLPEEWRIAWERMRDHNGRDAIALAWWAVTP